MVQGYATGVYLNGVGGGHELYGLRTEYCNVGLRVGATEHHVHLYGGCFDNFLLAGSGSSIGIQIDAGAADVLLAPSFMANLQTPIVDAGIRTRYGSLPLGKAVAATALGTLVKKKAVYDVYGNLEGYVPLYASIS